jgi:hypothetical protein
MLLKRIDLSFLILISILIARPSFSQGLPTA